MKLLKEIYLLNVFNSPKQNSLQLTFDNFTRRSKLQMAGLFCA